MPYNIIVGRNEADKKKFGDLGVILLGRSYVKMGRTTSLSNYVFMDIVRSHIVYVVGKRGSGKSYTMGVIAEGIVDLPEEIRKNLSIIILDTMGIYWTMKYPNQKDEDLLEKWGIEGKGLDVAIFTPKGYYKKTKESGIPTDFPFSIKPSELNAEDWVLTFELEEDDPVSVLIQKTINDFEDEGIKGYGLKDIIQAIKKDKDFPPSVRINAINRFELASHWGVFDDKEGTPIDVLVRSGQVTVLDVSAYATGPGGWGVKSLVIGLIARKMFIERMISRKKEEIESIKTGYSYFQVEEEVKAGKKPLVWLIIDEAHEFLPKSGKTAATDALVTILREGRQPGISLILATQQPGKIHGDVMTQSDIVISHRITAKPDVDALNSMMQSYLSTTLTGYLNNLPREKGAALILDDNSERIYPIRVRPRFTWHGGEAPTAIKVRRKLNLGL